MIQPSSKPKVISVTQIPLRWRTQIFILKCASHVINVVKNTGLLAHFDLESARKSQSSNADFLVFRLSDLIGIAFNSSTTNIRDLNLEGLHLLNDILIHYGNTKDPDVNGHLLLEQYQAQISAALTPAFESSKTL